MTTNAAETANPVMAHPWPSAPFGLPPLQDMKACHFTAAFERDMKVHLSEIDAIVGDSESPTFENTVVPLDRAGAALDATSRCFGVLCASATYPELQKVEMDLAAVLANHSTSIYSNAPLFARLDAVHEHRHAAQPPLTSEQLRCVERLHLDFVRAGARFDMAAKERYAAIVARLAELQVRPRTLSKWCHVRALHPSSTASKLCTCPAHRTSAGWPAWLCYAVRGSGVAPMPWNRLITI
jgi:peptidyl-dipeptidase Dcp